MNNNRLKLRSIHKCRIKKTIVLYYTFDRSKYDFLSLKLLLVFSGNYEVLLFILLLLSIVHYVGSLLLSIDIYIRYIFVNFSFFMKNYK